MNSDQSQNMRSVSPDAISEDRVNPGVSKQIRIDPVEIRRTLSILTDPEQVFELRVQDATRKDSSRYPFLASGYFNNPEALIKAPATSDSHIIVYRWLLIDTDPDRPADISSSEEEHQAALTLTRHIQQVLRDEGWPEPVLADSGNGGHLLYRLNLPVNEADLVKRVLAGLAVRFDVAAEPEQSMIGLHIDQTVYNPSRICKLYGTLACKGDNTLDRPHRLARLLKVPDRLDAVPRYLLETIADNAPEMPIGSGKSASMRSFDLTTWIEQHHLDVIGPRPWKNGGKRWIFRVCPWNAEHTDKSAYIVQQVDGAIAAGCQHNGCRGKGWKALRMLYEPEAYTSRIRSGKEGHYRHHAYKGSLIEQAPQDEPPDTLSLEQALADKDLLTIFNLIPALAQLSRGDYLAYKYRIKETFGKEINSNDLDTAVNEARKGFRENGCEIDARSQADILVELGEREVTFFATPGGICYAHIPVQGHYETWPIHERGGMFKLWLLKKFRDELGTIPNDKSLTQAMMTLTSNALYGDRERREVFTRLGYLDGKIYLDLANRAHQMVEIDGQGWRVLSHAPVYFRRYNGIGELPVPQQGGTLRLLDRFINADEESLLLAKAWVIGCLHPFGPYPTLGIHGERGAAKTTTARVLRTLVDPCVALLRSIPKDVQALTIAAANNHIIGFDNLSTMPVWLSDALCRAATGAGDAYRQLYTDADEVVFNFTKPIIFTGIEEVGTRGDFLDRCMLLNLPAIEETRRKTEKEFWHEFNAVHPLLLGALLDAVCLALRNYSQVVLPEKPRMADFAIWVTACEALILPEGKPPHYFIKVYSENREEAVEIEIESSPIGAAIKTFMEGRQEVRWEGTAEYLLKVLNEKVPEDTRHDRGWPRNARALSGKIKRLATSLRSIGIHVRWSKVKGQRIITLLKASSMQGDTRGVRGDANR